jgi:hypothetical protein
VWQAITEFLLKAHASGLGHDAVIEIMLAILGVMIAVLGFMLAAVGIFFALLSLYGFNTIKQESKKVAAKIAKDEAATLINQEIRKLAIIDNTAALSATEDLDPLSKPEDPVPSPVKKGRKTSDAGLTSRRKRHDIF